MLDQLLFDYQIKAPEYRKKHLIVKRSDAYLSSEDCLKLAYKLDCKVCQFANYLLIDFTVSYDDFVKQIKHNHQQDCLITGITLTLVALGALVVFQLPLAVDLICAIIWLPMIVVYENHQMKEPLTAQLQNVVKNQLIN